MSKQEQQGVCSFWFIDASLVCRWPEGEGDESGDDGSGAGGGGYHSVPDGGEGPFAVPCFGARGSHVPIVSASSEPRYLALREIAISPKN